MAVDWTDLPGELLQLIAKKLTVYSDYVRFRAVCPHWGSSVPSGVPRHLPPQFPWLMLPLSESQPQSHLSFYDLSTDETHHVELPEPEASCHELRIDSSNGWLVILDISSAIVLLNPLTLDKLHLPPLSSFPNIVSLDFSQDGMEYTIRDPFDRIYWLNLREMRDFFVKKIVLSSGLANKDNLIAVAILDWTGELAYCKNGDPSWTSLVPDLLNFACCDVTYYKEKFYAVDRDGSIAVCDVNGESPSLWFHRVRFSTLSYACHVVHLVNSGDELLLVVRQLDHQLARQAPFMFYLRTVRFEVYRMNWTGRQPWWSEVEDLGDRLLFVGANSCVSLSAADVRGCLRNPRYMSENDFYVKNCIYFTDDNRVSCYDGGGGGCKIPPPYDRLHRDDDGAFDWDRGIYSLRVEGLSPFRKRIIPLSCRTRDPHALWVTPTP